MTNSVELNAQSDLGLHSYVRPISPSSYLYFYGIQHFKF